MIVTGLKPEAEGVLSVVLAAADGTDLPPWTPGSHVDLLLPEEMLRQYSLIPGPSGAWRIAVLAEAAGRGGSAYVHQRLRVGDELRVRGPRNTFELDEDDGPLLLVAGGIGITPLLSMVRQAHATGRDWTLLYLGATRQRMAFLAELAEYGSRVRVHESSAGRMDLAQFLAEQRNAVGAMPTVYACGPERMSAELAGLCAGGGRYRCETFLDAAPGAALAAGEKAFLVKTSDGTEVEVAADETILQALARSGVRTLSSCQQGTCGTCETPVLEGVPDHRDEVLTEEEQLAGETMMICVSRCHGPRLVLDL